MIFDKISFHPQSKLHKMCVNIEDTGQSTWQRHWLNPLLLLLTMLHLVMVEIPQNNNEHCCTSVFPSLRPLACGDTRASSNLTFLSSSADMASASLTMGNIWITSSCRIRSSIERILLLYILSDETDSILHLQWPEVKVKTFINLNVKIITSCYGYYCLKRWIWLKHHKSF